MDKLKGKHVQLRALEPSDLDFLYQIENDESFWETSGTQTPFSKHTLTQYLKNAHLDIYTTKQIRFGIEDNDQKLIGLIDLFDFEPKHLRAGVGILIQQAYQNKGYATEAFQLLHNYAFAYLNLKQLYANIITDNLNSISLFKKLGYQQSGIQKKWILSNGKFKDVAFYQFIPITT